MGGGREDASVVRSSENAVVRNLGDLFVSAVRYSPETVTGCHRHGRPQLVVTVAGLVRTRFPDRTLEAGPGDVLTHPADLYHTHEFGLTGAEIVTVATARIDVQAQGPDHLLESFGVRSMGASLPLARRIRRELARDDAHADLALRSLALQLLVATARGQASGEPPLEPPPVWVGQAKARLDADFGDQVRIGRLATRIGVTPMQLIRAFQRHYGTSPGAYLRQVRLQHALSLLTEATPPLANVALEAGYSDQSHLCRVIKEETGLTPAEYRRTFQND